MAKVDVKLVAFGFEYSIEEDHVRVWRTDWDDRRFERLNPTELALLAGICERFDIAITQAN